MASSTRAITSAILVLSLVGGLLLLVFHMGGPETGPVIRIPDQKAPRPYPSDDSPLPPVCPDPGPPPFSDISEDKPLSTPDTDPGIESRNALEPPEGMVVAVLVDSRGSPLPWASVIVQTLNPPKAILTRGPTWTDKDGKFHFHQPEGSNVLYAWCPDLQTSARRPWQPLEMESPVLIRLTGKVLTGRIIDDSGQAPDWKGVNLRICIVPPWQPGNLPDAPPRSTSTPVSLDRKTGRFLAVLKNSLEKDLTLSALGQTGEILLRRISHVNRIQKPLLIQISDPRPSFGTLSVTILGAPTGTKIATLEVVSGGTPDRLPLSGNLGQEQKTGPLARGTYLVRAVAGNRISIWKQVWVAPGICQPLGILEVRKRAILHVRCLGPDGMLLKGVQIGLEDDQGRRVRARFRADSRGLLAEDLFPGKYRVVIRKKMNGISASPLWVSLKPGGLHDHPMQFVSTP